MGKRPRIIKEEIFETDPLEFKKNKCSDNARKIFTKSENVEFDIWFDKHYYTRVQFGEDNGEKREGIDIALIRRLIVLVAKHVIYYSLRVDRFSVVNFSDDSAAKIRRIVIQADFKDQQKLNIIVECHYLSANKYEMTVKTAIRKDDFYYRDGQFLIQLNEDESSVLFKKEVGRINKISEWIL